MHQTLLEIATLLQSLLLLLTMQHQMDQSRFVSPGMDKEPVVADANDPLTSDNEIAEQHLEQISVPESNTSNKKTTADSEIGNQSQVLFTEHSIIVDNNKRSYLLFTPNENPRALWVLLHGGDESMYFITGSSATARQFRNVAQEYNVALVVPNGTNKKTGAFDAKTGCRWNDRRVGTSDFFANGPMVEAVDDQSFLATLVAKIQSESNLSPQKTFVVGISNGGFMAQDMIITNSQLFGGGASLLAAVTPLMLKPLPQHPRPMLLWNTTEDPFVQYEGVTGVLRSADASAKWWARANGLNVDSVTTQIVSSADNENCYTNVTIYSGDLPVHHYVTHGGGHILPSKTYTYDDTPWVKYLVERRYGRQCHDIDAIYETWRFFNSNVDLR